MKPVRVLVVDDDADIRYFLKTWFGTHPNVEVVGEASDGAEALAAAASLHPDVVLLDLGMPGLSGVEAFPALSGLCSRIVIYSAFRDAEREVRGAAAYPQKGCSLEELTRTVTTLAGAA